MKVIFGYLIIRFSLLLFLVTLFCLPNTSPVNAEELIIISNLSYPTDKISVADLKEIYLGNRSNAGRMKIRPLNQNNSSHIKEVFLKKVFNTTIDQYEGYWIKRLFNEGIKPPVTKASSQTVIDAVISENGTIGYVWLSETADIDGIKVLLRVKE